MAAIETAWSLQGAGFRVIAFRRAGQRPAVRHVRGITLYDVPAPEVDALGTIRAVESLVQTLRPAAILPLDDHAVWVCSRLDDLEVPVAGPTGAAAELTLDKSIQVAAAERAGLPVLATQVLDDPREAGPVGSPVIVKSARPVCEIGGALIRPTAVVCADDRELARAAEQDWHGPVLVQPLIHGVGEGVFGHATADGIVGWSGHRRVRMINPHGSGSSACRSHPVDGQLVGPAHRFLAGIGWRGMFMLEFLRDEHGTPWFMELNGRPWGSMALARRRGFEYPAWSVQAALDPRFTPTVPEHPPEIVCRNLGLDLVHLLFVARGPQSDAPVQWPRMIDAVRDVVRRQPGGRLYNWNPAQPQVFVADVVGTLGQFGRKLVRRRG
jgi:biotin carboxylase